MADTAKVEVGEQASFLKTFGKAFGARFVIARFDGEGRGIENALRAKEFAFQSGLSFCVSIGGCEAIRDIQDARNIGADIIHAPLIESDFALKKFGQAIAKVYDGDAMPRVAFSIESDMGYNNASAMFATGGLADTLISRADFVCMDFSYFDLALVNAAKARGLSVIVTGAGQSVHLLSRLFEEGRIDGVLHDDIVYFPESNKPQELAALFEMEIAV